MAFLDVIDEIDEMLEEAWTFPIGGKTLVDGEMIKEKMEKLRLEFPSEIKKAKSVLDERERILEKAKNDAQQTVRNASIKREALLNEQQIVVDAKIRSEEILKNANEEAAKLRKAAIDYVNAALKKTETIMENNILAVKQARRAVNGESE